MAIGNIRACSRSAEPSCYGVFMKGVNSIWKYRYDLDGQLWQARFPANQDQHTKEKAMKIGTIVSQGKQVKSGF